MKRRSHGKTIRSLRFRAEQKRRGTIAGDAVSGNAKSSGQSQRTEAGISAQTRE